MWSYNRVANGTANIPTPIIAGDFVFGSSSYNTGSGLVRLTRSGSGVMAKQQYFLNKDTFQNHHGGMVMVGEYIYSGHNHGQGFPICIQAASGKVMWGGDQRGPGDGSAAVVYADGHLIFRYQNGVVGVIEANPKAYKLIAKFTPAYVKTPSWSHPVVANGMLYLREQDQLMCYKLK